MTTVSNSLPRLSSRYLSFVRAIQVAYTESWSRNAISAGKTERGATQSTAFGRSKYANAAPEKGLPCSEPQEAVLGRPKRNPDFQWSNRDSSTDGLRKRKRDTELDVVHEESAEQDPSVTTESPQGPQSCLQSKFPDWAFMLSWYPMLKRAMAKLEQLNNDILQVFGLDSKMSTPRYEAFASFTQRLVPLVLNEATCALQAHPENQMALFPLLARLLNDCIYTAPADTRVSAMACCELPYTVETKRKMFAQADDIVNDFQMRIDRLVGHVQAKVRSQHRCSCDDGSYIQSELDAIVILVGEINARVQRIFDTGFFGLELPPTIKDSAIFIDDHCVYFNALFVGEEFLDCLGRTGLHRFYDLGQLLVPAPGESVQELPWSVHEKFKGNFKEIADAFARTDLLGRNPLHILIRHGLLFTEHLPTASTLKLETKNTQTVYGHSLLHYASSCMDPPFTDLKSLGLDPNLKDRSGNTAFFYVGKRGSVEVLESFFWSSRALSQTVRLNTRSLSKRLGATEPMSLVFFHVHRL
ncbi:hypothetical protein BU23DRAFT_282107 [Bimuria novae-zelandiae CBS 107.79]|uniref:Uncharacterized protein n=1 Tax=Bimuria novae-zelandiae CBS 107.79 TaxID=1447943 RepID=A0A6A5UT41_9PLEO|nr:hypothetical protein BU23DRAFT_282107 [Bimuria novae-zelandiae CBS 107.79]